MCARRNCRTQLVMHNARRHMQRNAAALAPERHTVLGPRQRSAWPALRAPYHSDGDADGALPPQRAATTPSPHVSAGGGWGERTRRLPPLVAPRPRSDAGSGSAGRGGAVFCSRVGEPPPKRARAAEGQPADGDGAQPTAAYMQGANWQVGASEISCKLRQASG